MCYIVATPEIKRKFNEVRKYLARNEEEDAGNGFIKDTPERILEYNKEVIEYYSEGLFDSKGRAIM